MKKIQARYPTTIQECTPEQLTKWLLLAPVIQEKNEELVNMLDFHCQVISVFTGLTMSQVRKAHVDDILDLSSRLLKMLGEYKSAEPSGVITIDGQRYVFEKDFNYISTGQIIDLKLIEDLTATPEQALAICYVEEGMEYCQEDHRGKILNPNKKREDLFKQSFPGDEFLNFFGFFLHESKRRKLAILGIQTARMMETNRMLMKELSEIPSGSLGQRSSSGLQRVWEKMWMRSQDSPM